MPSENWYWEQFDVKQRGGEFDLDSSQTSFLDEQNISRELANQIETDFIDELYGTTEGKTIIDGKNQELSREEWTRTYYDDNAAIQSGEVTEVWGLDIRRTMKDEDGQTVTPKHPEYFEYLTGMRGNVAWNEYKDDPAFVAKAKEMKEDWNILTDDDYSVKERISTIRRVKAEMDSGGTKADEDKSHLDWDKYKVGHYRNEAGDLIQIGDDGKETRVPTLKDLWSSGGGRLTVNKPSKHTPILQRREVGRPVIPGVSWSGDTPRLTNPTKVKIPASLGGAK